MKIRISSIEHDEKNNVLKTVSQYDKYVLSYNTLKKFQCSRELQFTLEKSDSLGTKSRRKRLWHYLGGCRSKQTRRNLVRNVIAWIVVVFL